MPGLAAPGALDPETARSDSPDLESSDSDSRTPAARVEHLAGERALRGRVRAGRQLMTRNHESPEGNPAVDPQPVPLEELLPQAASYSRPLFFDLGSSVPLIGPVIALGKRLLRRVARTYIARQSATNEYLIQTIASLAEAQRQGHVKLNELAAESHAARATLAGLAEAQHKLGADLAEARQQTHEAHAEAERQSTRIAEVATAVETRFAEASTAVDASVRHLGELQTGFERHEGQLESLHASVEPSLRHLGELQSGFEGHQASFESLRASVEPALTHLEAVSASVESSVRHLGELQEGFGQHELRVWTVEQALEKKLGTAGKALDSALRHLGELQEGHGSHQQELESLAGSLRGHREKLGRLAELLAVPNDCFVIAHRRGPAHVRSDNLPDRGRSAAEGHLPAALLGCGELRPTEGNVQLMGRYVPYFEGCAKVLDVGCGRGDFLALLAEQGIGGLGADHDSGSIERCAERGFEALEGDVLELLDSSAVDGIDGMFVSHLIEHLTPSEALRLLALAHRKLPEGAPVVILTPNAAGLFTHLVHFWRDPTHVRLYPVELLERSLEVTGYTVDASGGEPDGSEGYWQI